MLACARRRTSRPSHFRSAFGSSIRKALIDQSDSANGRGIEKLGAAEYRLVHHARNGRSVYSFCMCPGGTVVAATSEPGRVVTKGMSQYSRNERNANAGIVVGITPEDYAAYGTGPLAGIALQRHWESQAFIIRRRKLCRPRHSAWAISWRTAPPPPGCGDPVLSAGRIADQPGASVAGLCGDCHPRSSSSLRPPASRLRHGRCRVTGVETRTSSPVRVPRGADFQSINTKGLYPGGEGAG